MNGTLYQFLLPDEQKSGEEKVVRHVVIKADVRDSSRLTRSLMEKGMNPASYFSLNFYDPVNKLLTKYGAVKVFLEGDAIILAILEREGEPGLGVGRASVLAREIVEIVRGYNQLVERAGLPGIELGVGISVPGFSAHVPDGRRAANHDLGRAQRERPAVLLQQARAQDHEERRDSVSRLCVPDGERRRPAGQP